MLIQWHLLMARLQQSDEAYESLATDIGTVGTESEPPTVKASQSGIALKKLHQKLGNRGFQQFVEMKQASHLASAAYNVASKPQAKTELAEDLHRDIQTSPELDSGSKLQDQNQLDNGISAQAGKGEQAPNSDNERSSNEDKVDQKLPEASRAKVIPIKSSQTNEQIIPSLLLAFKQSLPMPTNTLWQMLDKHYLQMQEQQQIKLISNLSGLLKKLINEQLSIFLASIEKVSSLQVVQAVLAKILPQVSDQTITSVEIDEPTVPNED
ncbi:MAG: hypothetical protein ACI82S_001741 [Patiriisocius sp.]|jgi:hypothetical protein